MFALATTVASWERDEEIRRASDKVPPLRIAKTEEVSSAAARQEAATLASNVAPKWHP